MERNFRVPVSSSLSARVFSDTCESGRVDHEVFHGFSGAMVAFIFDVSYFLLPTSY